MLFVNWWLVGETTLAVLMIAAGAIGFRKVKKLPLSITRFGVRLVCVPIAATGILLGLLLLVTRLSGCESVSSPIYSPSRRVAARVYDYDEGATGGGTQVKLFWAQGLRQANVFAGPWKAVEPQDVYWISDSELMLSYRADAPSDQYACKGTSAVHLVCVPKQR